MTGQACGAATEALTLLCIAQAQTQDQNMYFQNRAIITVSWSWKGVVLWAARSLTPPCLAGGSGRGPGTENSSWPRDTLSLEQGRGRLAASEWTCEFCVVLCILASARLLP